MRTLHLFIFLIIGCFFVACANYDEQSNFSKEQIAQANLPDQSNPLSNPKSPRSVKEIKRKIIKTGNIQMEVKSYMETRGQIDEVIEEFEAYLSSELETNNDHKLGSSLTIKVKNEEFEALMDKITNLGFVVEQRQISTSDVTAEFVDITARLKTKKEVEDRYLTLLNRANTIGEILEIEEKARIIREEIESTEGRLKYLQNQVSFSTIEVYLYQKSEFSKANLREPSFFSQLGMAISDGWSILLSFIVIIFRFWPFLFVVAGLLYISWRRKSRDKTGKYGEEVDGINGERNS